MREITREIVSVFERNAMENAKQIGIDRVLIFGEGKPENQPDGLNAHYVSVHDLVGCGKFPVDDNAAAFCSFIHASDNLQGDVLRRYLQSVAFLPEGTTVVFTHGEDMGKIEKIMSEEGFRTIEHFNADRAGESAFKIIEKDLRENTCFCLGIRK